MSKRLSKTKKAEIAFQVHQEIISIKEALSTNFLELGKRLCLMFENRHFIRLDYDNWAEYLATPEVAISQGTASKLISIYKELVVRHGFSKLQLKKIEWSKLAEIIPIIKKIENKEEAGDWVGKAETLSQRDLRIVVKEDKRGVQTSDCKHIWKHREFWKCKECDIISYVKPYGDKIED